MAVSCWSRRHIVRANLRSAKIAALSPPTIEMIGVVAVAVLLFFGQREIIAGRMNAAQFLTFLFFLFRSYDPMRKLSRLSEQHGAGSGRCTPRLGSDGRARGDS